TDREKKNKREVLRERDKAGGGPGCVRLASAVVVWSESVAVTARSPHFFSDSASLSCSTSFVLFDGFVMGCGND
ncbi:hypothetical protein A2U01_0101827, partial [Trifolium medium]|nr:hypothetical protein [Trifolium medium]